jgi:hypothetical protein
VRWSQLKQRVEGNFASKVRGRRIFEGCPADVGKSAAQE